jgi:hypothetical protein
MRYWSFNPDAVLARAVALEGFQTIPGWNTQVSQAACDL